MDKEFSGKEGTPGKGYKDLTQDGVESGGKGLSREWTGSKVMRTWVDLGEAKEADFLVENWGNWENQSRAAGVGAEVPKQQLRYF